jgi:hypothetical protein
MLVFSVKEDDRNPQTFQGFCSATRPLLHPELNLRLVSAFNQGHLEWWYVEEPYAESVDELLRMYRMLWGHEPVVQVWGWIVGGFPSQIVFSP